MNLWHLCKVCGEDLDHISRCEADGHRDHHQGCCPDREHVRPHEQTNVHRQALADVREMWNAAFGHDP